MKKIGFIVARDVYSTIGTGTDLPDWSLKDDLRFFQRQTAGCPIIMGRKNYESIPERFRPLPNRNNIVLSHNPLWDAGSDDVRSFQSLWDALSYAEQCAGDIIWIIGGAEIYRLALPRTELIHLTRVQAIVGVACFTRYTELLAHVSSHGIYYFVPGLLKHFDTEAIYAIVAPRPMLMLSGDQD